MVNNNPVNRDGYFLGVAAVCGVTSKIAMIKKTPCALAIPVSVG